MASQGLLFEVGGAGKGAARLHTEPGVILRTGGGPRQKGRWGTLGIWFYEHVSHSGAFCSIVRTIWPGSGAERLAF